MNMKLKFYSLLILVIVVYSCNKRPDLTDLEFEDWKPIAAFPLVDTEINVHDVLNEFNHPEELLILDNGELALNYKGFLGSIGAAEILVLEDQNISEVLPLSETEALSLDASTEPITYSINTEFQLDFSPAEVRVDNVLFTGGTLEVSVTRLQNESISGELIITELMDENDLPVSVTVAGNMPVGTAEIITVDLTGKKLMPIFSPPESNKISLTGELELENNAGNTAEAGDLLEFSLNIQQPEFQSIIGDFGNLLISNDTDSVEINLFTNVQGGTFAVEEAIINLNITNSFGLPMQFDLGEVVSVNQNTGEEIQLIFNDSYLDGQEELEGSPEMKTFVFDNSNSSINQLFSPAPVVIAFDLTASANPDGPPINPNFITNQSQLDAEIDVIIPLSGYINTIQLSDTIDADISFDSYEEIDSIEFKIQTENYFPVEVNFQAFFLDSTNTIVDSLFVSNEEIISTAITDTDGMVIESAQTEKYVLMDGPRSELVSSSEKIIISAIFDTYNSDQKQSVVITEDQKLNVKLGAIVYGKIEL